MKVEITKEHAGLGRYDSASECAAALALNEALGLSGENGDYASVTREFLTVFIGYSIAAHVDTPPALSEFIKLPHVPFGFELDDALGMQVEFYRNRDRGNDMHLAILDEAGDLNVLTYAKMKNDLIVQAMERQMDKDALADFQRRAEKLQEDVKRIMDKESWK